MMVVPSLTPSAIEKGSPSKPSIPDTPSTSTAASSSTTDSSHSSRSTNILVRWHAKIESLAAFEARGIARVPPDERHKASTFGLVQMALLWFSANLTANNLTLAMLGPLVYQLSFLDSALCAICGCVIGSAGAAYMGTWGPGSGNRTLVSETIYNWARDVLSASMD